MCFKMWLNAMRYNRNALCNSWSMPSATAREKSASYQDQSWWSVQVNVPLGTSPTLYPASSAQALREASTPHAKEVPVKRMTRIGRLKRGRAWKVRFQLTNGITTCWRVGPSCRRPARMQSSCHTWWRRSIIRLISSMRLWRIGTCRIQVTLWLTTMMLPWGTISVIQRDSLKKSKLLAKMIQLTRQLLVAWQKTEETKWILKRVKTKTWQSISLFHKSLPSTRSAASSK